MLKMSGHSLPSPAISLLILSLLIPFSLFIRSSEACGNSVYWGQNVSEGSLKAACSNPYPYYKYIVIAFLTSYGGVPDLNLDRHCDTSLGNCKKFASEIEYCQNQGIKVLLSVDGTFGKNSPSTANQLAQYLYDKFLHGLPGPLGKVALDGIDFYIDRRGSTEFWVALAKALSQYTTPNGKVHLSASPQCRLDFNQVGAISTGLFDYLWVQFYKNPSCDISAGVSGLVEAWNDWSSFLSQISPDSQLFMGLPASPEVDSGGYIDPNVLAPEILPVLRNTSNYGGLMLWNRYYDVKNSYSPRVVVLACSGPPAPPPTVIPIPPREDLLVAEV